MEKTAIQKAIDEVQRRRENGDNDLRQIIYDLKSLLPYEKQFMQGVFAAGGFFALDQFKNPKFDEYYSQFNP